MMEGLSDEEGLAALGSKTPDAEILPDSFDDGFGLLTNNALFQEDGFGLPTDDGLAAEDFNVAPPPSHCVDLAVGLCAFACMALWFGISALHFR